MKRSEPNRSSLRCDPPDQENPHQEPGMEMLTRAMYIFVGMGVPPPGPHQGSDLGGFGVEG